MMKKTLLTCLLCTACLAEAAQTDISSTSTVFTWHDKAPSTFTLGDVKGTFSASVSSKVYNYGLESTANEWTNTTALAAMNNDLGLTLTAANLKNVCASGNASSHSTLTLDFSDSAYALVTTPVTLYVSVGHWYDSNPSTNMSSIEVTGMSDITYSSATYNGTGFTNGLTFAPGMCATTLIKMTGTLTDDTLTITSDNVKNGFGVVALKGVKAVPEPATATLSLLALAGLAVRRRRM